MNVAVRSIERSSLPLPQDQKQPSRFARYAIGTEQFWKQQFGSTPTTDAAQVVTVVVLAIGFLVAFLPMVAWAVFKAVRS